MVNSGVDFLLSLVGIVAESNKDCTAVVIYAEIPQAVVTCFHYARWLIQHRNQNPIPVNAHALETGNNQRSDLDLFCGARVARQATVSLRQ